MENIANVLADIKARKEDNNKVTNGLAEVNFDQKLNALDNKYGWHSTVNNYVTYVLALLLALLYLLSFYAYFRLEDRQSAGSEKLSELHKDVYEKIDSQTKYIIQRSDEDRQNLRNALSDIKTSQKVKR